MWVFFEFTIHLLCKIQAILSLVIASFLFTFADLDASALSKRSGRQFTQMDVCVPRGNVESDGTQTMCVECNARTTLPADRYENKVHFPNLPFPRRKIVTQILVILTFRPVNNRRNKLLAIFLALA